jgi:hypothetical protein
MRMVKGVKRVNRKEVKRGNQGSDMRKKKANHLA